MPGRRLDEFEKRQVLDLRAKNCSYAKIAAITGRAKSTMMDVCQGGSVDLLRRRREYAQNPPRSWNELDDVGKHALEDFQSG